MTNPERWERLQDLFHRLRLLSPTERSRVLDQEPDIDPALRAEVEQLLAANDAAGDFIEEPAVLHADEGLTTSDGSQVGRRIGAYRIVRAVGRGGMGAVYLAERDDGAFTQRVAVKLIKRGMDTDLVLARFRAERQILASLDHPNIARLLDGGTTDDGLPFLAMEFIDGQPIDSYAEAMQAGVEERLRLFLQVCDAVSYAHARGVIHRDIKPLNTLVTTSGVPKLLDFGIAKVLHDSTEEQSTTITGLRLLTPDYASPEQIEGRKATVSSDVYSLGVLLFELLTGRSPYPIHARTPQAVASAVVTGEPDRPSTVVTQPADQLKVRRALPATTSRVSNDARARELSRRLRGDLDTIVLTALRKEPDRRYASVAALAEDVRRHLTGHPIMARSDSTIHVLARFARRQRTPLLVSAALVLLATAAIVSLRPAAVEPTLLGTAALAPRDRIVVADFTEAAGDTLLAAAITEVVRTDLSQSPVIRVLTPRQVRTSLVTMQASPDIALNDSVARELALRESVKAIVTGSIAHVSGAWTLTMQLVAAQNGETLVAVRETARDSTQLIAAVDRASRGLRRRIGESLRQMQGTTGLVVATTASLPALRLYSTGQRLVRAGRRTEAVRYFEDAVAIDSGFASAYLGASMAYGAIGDFGRAYDLGDRAIAHQDRLPFVERNFLVGSRAAARQDYATAIRAYTDVVQRYPDNVSAINNLALAYRDARQYAVAESLFVRARQIDTTVANFVFGLHTTQILQSKFSKAAETMDTLRLRFPDNPVYLTEAMQDAAAQQDWQRATQFAWSHIEQLGADTLQLVDPYEALAQMAMIQGRLRESERLWAVHAKLARASGMAARGQYAVVQRAQLMLRYRGDTVGALAFVDSALRATPFDSLTRADRRYDEFARFYLAAGRVERARPLLTAAEENDSALHRALPGERIWTHGLLAMGEGRNAVAIDSLRVASEINICPSCVLPDLGRAYERAGRTQEAMQTYERYLVTPWIWRYEPDAVDLVWVLERLAALSAQAGDSTRAMGYRRQRRTLWDAADAPLRSALEAKK